MAKLAVKIAGLNCYVDDQQWVELIAIRPEHAQVVGAARIVHAATDTPTLGDLYVIPGFRRLGLGRELVRYAKAWAEENCKTLFLHVRPDNPARQLYLSEGFELTGEVIEDGSEWMAYLDEEVKRAVAQEGGQADD